MTQAIASLGMYDPPALHAANDALWSVLAAWLRGAGVADVPDRLTRDRPLDMIWSDPDLLLAQTCGYPLVTRWRDRLRYVATPAYTAPGCEGTDYRSRLVVRARDEATSLAGLRGRVAAINERGSNSGMNLLRAATAPLAQDGRFYKAVVETGSHRSSIQAVVEGRAHVAAIDVVTFAHLERHEPALTAGLRTIGWTEATPALPFVTAADRSPAMVTLLRAGLRHVMAAPEMTKAREALALREIMVIPEQDYDRVLELERSARRQGYADLA